MNHVFLKKGITVIEILIVLLVIGVLATVALPGLSKIRENQVLKNAVSNVSSALNKARAETLASVNSSEYGVRFEANQVIIFKGKVFSASDPGNEIIPIVAPAAIINVTLNGVSGVAGDFYFSRIYGTPSKTGTITITTPVFSKIITISPTGATSIN